MGNVLFDMHNVCSTRRNIARPVVSGRVDGQGTYRARESAGVRESDRKH